MGRLAISLGMLCVVCSLAVGATTNQLSQYGITWTFSGQYAYGQFANGDYWVVGPVTITSISPGSTESGGRTMNGSMINPSNTGMTQGYDSAMWGGGSYSASLNVALDVSAGNPLVAPNGSSLISSISHPTPGLRPQLTDAAVLTVLPSAPAAGSFRPPYYETDKTIHFNKSDLDYTKLPRLTPPAGAPSISSVEGGCQRVWLDHVLQYMGRDCHPSNNMPDYGRDMAYSTGTQSLALLLDYTDAEKETLLIRMTQLGIDLYAIFKDGGTWPNNGGHNLGRKMPMLLAGLVLGDSDMLAVGQSQLRFQEDQQTWIVTQDDVGRPLYHDDGRLREEYIQEDVGIPEWGEKHTGSPQRDGRNWSAYYRTIVGGSILSHVLTANILGLRDEWNWEPLFLYMDRYVIWGAEMGGDGALSFHKGMWNLHRYSTVGPTVATPIFTPNGCTFAGSVDVVIACSTGGATVYYTTDGNTPTTSSTQYTGPITLSSTTTLTAVAVKSGLIDSSRASATFAVEGDLAPVAKAGPDRHVADDDANGFEIITLDGSASRPRSGETITGCLWREGSTYIGSNAVQLAVLSAGEHTLTLEVTDSSGAKATDEVVITIGAASRPGDADGDGDVDLDDFVILKQSFGQDPLVDNRADFDGDGDVDLDDFVILKKNFATPSGATVSEGDFDGDGNVDLDDFVILKKNFAAAAQPVAPSIETTTDLLASEPVNEPASKAEPRWAKRRRRRVVESSRPTVYEFDLLAAARVVGPLRRGGLLMGAL